MPAKRGHDLNRLLDEPGLEERCFFSLYGNIFLPDTAKRGEFFVAHSPLPIPPSPLQQRRFFQPSMTAIADHFWSILLFFRRAFPLCYPMQSGGNESCLDLHAHPRLCRCMAHRIITFFYRLLHRLLLCFDAPRHDSFYAAATSAAPYRSWRWHIRRDDHFEF